MMKKFKKMMAIILGVGTLLALTACGDGKDVKKEEAENTVAKTEITYKAGETYKAKEPITYSLLFSDHENYPYKKDWLLWEAITEKTNVSFDITTVSRADYAEKRTLLISSGQAPLIIPKTYAGEEIPFVPSGTILPVSDYIDYMPNFKEKIEKWNLEPDLNEIRQADGRFYLLPGIHEVGGGGYSYLIRKDIFDELGITIDEANYTYDKFYEDLKKVKAAYPDKYVISDRFTGNSLLKIASKQYGVTAGWSKGKGTKFNFEEEAFFYGPTSDKYKTFLTYMNQLVADGILDPESFIQTDDQAIAKFTTGETFVISSNPQIAQDMLPTLDATLGKDNYEAYMITSPGGPEGQLMVETTRLENGVMINSKALDLGEEGFKEFMHFVDWLWYSDEGQTLSKWGVEGKTYDVVDGKKVLKSDIYHNGLNPGAPKKLNADYGFSGGVFAYGGNIDLKTSMYSDFEKDFYERSVTLREAAPIDPPIMFSEDENEQNNLISSPLMDYVDQMTLKFILGEADIKSEWDAYVKACEAKGSTTFINNVNTTYENTKHLLK